MALVLVLAASCAPPAPAASDASGSTTGSERAASTHDISAGTSPTPTAVPTALGHGAAPVAREPEPLPSDPVYLNGERLSDADLRELEAVLGRAPTPGRYWYDPRSGLWGLEQHGAGGATRPGLRVPAPLPAQASAGSSGAFVNDRQLTARELTVLAQLLGWDARNLGAYAGRYVLDERGRLYSHHGRYLGSLASAAERGRANPSSPAPCAWSQLGAAPDVLGRAVTINCD